MNCIDLTREWKVFYNLDENYQPTTDINDAQFIITKRDIQVHKCIFYLRDLLTNECFVLKVIRDDHPGSEDVILTELVERCGDILISVVKINHNLQHPQFKYILMQCGLDLREFLDKNSLGMLTRGRIGFPLKLIMMRMAMALWNINTCGYHHRDVRMTNFVIMPVDRVTPQKRTLGIELNGKQYTPQLIDFGLSRKHNDSDSINSQDFVRPPNFIYLNKDTPETELVYQDTDEIFALGMTFLDLLGLSPRVEGDIPAHYLETLACIYAQQQKETTNANLCGLLALRPTIQAVRLLVYFGWPPTTFTEFYTSPIGIQLRAFTLPRLDQNTMWNYFSVMCRLHLAQEPTLFKMLEAMLQWNRADRVQNFQLLMQDYFQPWLDE